MRMSSLVLAAFLAAATAPCAAAQNQDVTVNLLGYRGAVPPRWAPRKPASSMRLAEYVVPPSSAGPAAEVIVYFFGTGQGGNVQANLTRWKAQFSTPDGSPVPEAITRDSTGAFPITFAEYRGTYARGIGAGNPDSAKTGQALLAAIAETPHGTMFIQLFGNASSVAAERDTFERFVKGLHE
jgi:hypothetical protein